MAIPKPLAAEPVAVPGAAAVPPAPAAHVVPWWLPSWPICLAVGLFGLTCWIMWMLAPAKGHDPSQLFNMLAQAIVLTAFIGGPVAVAFTSSRDSQKKNEVIAAQAQVIASKTPNAGG